MNRNEAWRAQVDACLDRMEAAVDQHVEHERASVERIRGYFDELAEIGVKLGKVADEVRSL